jgi:hypothetical protein
VIHDLHESVAPLVTWNGTDLINEHVDPLTYAERLSSVFTKSGDDEPGNARRVTWNFGDDFAHLYLDAIATNIMPTVAATDSVTAPPRRCVGPARHRDQRQWFWPRHGAEIVPLVCTRQRQLQRDRILRRWISWRSSRRPY